MRLGQFYERSKLLSEAAYENAERVYMRMLRDPKISSTELMARTITLVDNLLIEESAGQTDKSLAEITAPKEEVLSAQETDELETERELISDHLYLFSPLVQMTLPHQDPKSVTYERTNGLSDLTWLSKEGVPYGIHARLLLLHVSTEAVKSGSPEVALGATRNSLVKQLKLTPSGAVNKSIVEQLNRLRASMLTIEDTKICPGQRKIINFQNNRIFSHGTFWWDDVDQSAGAYLNLSPEFYDALRESAVPFNKDALALFRKSCMEMDLYMYLSYRSKLRTRTPIPWVGLYRQIGSNFKELRQFKAKLLKALKKVAPHINGCEFMPVDRGLVIKKA